MKPTLVVNPSADESFAASCEEHLEEGADSIGELERRLRHSYPLAIVHVRELDGEGALIWYAYRDGHWIA